MYSTECFGTNRVLVWCWDVKQTANARFHVDLSQIKYSGLYSWVHSHCTVVVTINMQHFTKDNLLLLICVRCMK